MRSVKRSAFPVFIIAFILTGFLSAQAPTQPDNLESEKTIAVRSAQTKPHSTVAAQKQPIPFPKGFDFPADPTKLEAMIQNRDIARLRKHGWYLWAGMNQPGYNGWPIWRSWNITTQVFAPSSNEQPGIEKGLETPATTTGLSLQRHAANNATLQINYPIPFYTIPEVIRNRKKYKKLLKDTALAANIKDGANFQNNGDLMLVSEAFTQKAYQFIRDRHLYQASTLNALMTAGKEDVPQLPRRSMVLKHMYWPVKQDGLTALPIWDNPPSIGSYTGFEIQGQWKRAVAIDPSRSTIPRGETAKVTFLYGVKHPDGVTPLGPNTYQQAKVVSLKAFYHKKISQADYNALSIYDQLLLDLSFYWAHKRPFKAGDYVASIASHIITKEIPSWTFQSIWWTDNPNAGKYSTNRPKIPRAEGPWHHYLLTSEYGITIEPNSDELPVIYNPYIELASHPIQTNCRNCHIRAAWPNGSYLALPVPPNPNTTADIQYDNNIFRNVLRTDFLWTIKDRAK